MNILSLLNSVPLYGICGGFSALTGPVSPLAWIGPG